MHRGEFSHWEILFLSTVLIACLAVIVAGVFGVIVEMRRRNRLHAAWKAFTFSHGPLRPRWRRGSGLSFGRFQYEGAFRDVPIRAEAFEDRRLFRASLFGYRVRATLRRALPQGLVVVSRAIYGIPTLHEQLARCGSTELGDAAFDELIMLGGIEGETCRALFWEPAIRRTLTELVRRQPIFRLDRGEVVVESAVEAAPDLHSLCDVVTIAVLAFEHAAASAPGGTARGEAAPRG
jgi:hypothetical protein